MRRIPELDGLRALASLSILFYHLWFPDWFMGWTRVDLFFVLSGFLVTSVIIKKRDSANFFAAFWFRRVIRLVPAYLLALLGLTLINRFLPTPAPMDGLPYYLTFTQNVQHYWAAEPPAFIPSFYHTWSLALEFRFYLVWPLLVVLCGRAGLPRLCLFIIALTLAGRALGYSPTILAGRCDGLALGGLLAALLPGAHDTTRQSARLHWLFVAAGILGLAVILSGMAQHWAHPMPSPTWTILAVSSCYFATVGLTFLHSGHRALVLLRHPWLRYFGTISYGIYLFHPIVIRAADLFARNAGIAQGLPLDLLVIAVSLAAAAASWHFYEKPFLKLQDFVSYTPAPTPRTSPVTSREPALG